MFKYIVLLALVPAILATEGVTQCRDRSPMPDYINVAGCDRAPCLIQLGTRAEMTLGFNAPRDIEYFQPTVEAGVLGLWVDYALPNDVSVGCNFLLNTRCPLSSGEDVEYKFLFPIEENYPRISVSVELSLTDASGKFLCVTVPVRVVSAE